MWLFNYKNQYFSYFNNKLYIIIIYFRGTRFIIHNPKKYIMQDIIVYLLLSNVLNENLFLFLYSFTILFISNKWQKIVHPLYLL